jgi:hypothetical protein
VRLDEDIGSVSLENVSLEAANRSIELESFHLKEV